MVAVQVDAIHSFPSDIDMMKLDILPFSGSFANLNGVGLAIHVSWSVSQKGVAR